MNYQCYKPSLEESLRSQIDSTFEAEDFEELLKLKWSGNYMDEKTLKEFKKTFEYNGFGVGIFKSKSGLTYLKLVKLGETKQNEAL